MRAGLLGEKLQEISAMICHFYGNFKAEVLGLGALKLDLRRGHIILRSTIHVIRKYSRTADCNSDEEGWCWCCFVFAA